MEWQPVLVGGSILLFTGLGLVWPRVRPAFSQQDFVINVLSGAALFLFRLGLLAAVAVPLSWLESGLVDLSAVQHPVLQALAAFLLLDFTRYWVHRLDHRLPFLWQFHRVHHSSEHLDATSGLRMHWFDIIQLTAIPVLLFDVVFDISAFHIAALPAALSVGALFDAFEHSNLRFDVRKPVQRVWNLALNNPHFHSWHHTRDGVKKDGNYGQTLTIWDRLFGSDVTEPLPPELLGVEDSQALVNSFMGMQLLRSRSREI